ncbi:MULTISPECIES: hypothetical protein [Variovorax]|jgi:alkaline phosphatase D|uniref:hypothetical protein n=1 Tax=Variovorax TaxID=34072 RepID=UPI00086E9A44|nr:MULTISPECIES: hypothetical protein [Variovorax]MBN8754846.1 hypothetical protein [Variovorax sp.]ODU11764.1 MAG: hypothetical protein ABS94_34000 [Variovorax sp. SCN 67-85]ODV14873.1 MAG: hypothetical protein ABT25_33950 [Variovorax sp. SCN 67-20]OJZ05409.1 MAG: hypothetical protein BGP22_11675 [Variovorax sp. 67-131]UKI05144.1 hypothetical protein L3V85_20125 [Variovorax paradoxus]
MRIAFTSCMSAYSFPDQPVWDQIAQAQCNELVLLGDSAYYDADGLSTAEVQAMDANTFALHAHERLYKQVSHPGFSALVKTPTLRTHAIWDDHDFLWNGSCGAQVEGQPQYSHLLPPTRAVFARYRKALAARFAPGSFPQVPPPWAANVPPPGYSNVPLAENVLLHLTDGRSFKSTRGRKALMGSKQLDAFEAACIDASSDTVHLLASGVVFEANSGETWLDCAAEHDRLLALADEYRILILSGDVHHNKITQYPTERGRLLFEATASGAAICPLVTLGALQCNWGLLDIDTDRITVQVFQKGPTPNPQTIDRQNWRWVTQQAGA